MLDPIPDPDFEQSYQSWAADRSPQANAVILKTLDPVIDQAVKTHLGTSNPLMKARARKMTLGALGTYDPQRGRLKSHLYSQLQGLKRQHAQQRSILKVPERMMLDRRGLNLAGRELEDELGREPTDQELATRTGISTKRIARVRQFTPAMSEGYFAGLEGGGMTPEARGIGDQSTSWVQVVYDDLGPLDQKIMEWTLGLNGRGKLSNQEIARKLNRSPGAISQRKALIQKMLDDEQELSPFL
jgi:hypothetical protein